MPAAGRGRLWRCVIVVLLAGGLDAGLHADEGFWPFGALPREAIRRAYGYTIDDNWLRELQRASVRFPGGSGAFVSRDGLILTNHHVALSTLSKVSTSDHDLVRDGFLAARRSEELRAPGLEVSVLEREEDVTARVQAAASPEDSTEDAYAFRRAAMTIIEQEATARTGLKSEVVTFFQGGRYYLHGYRRYTDIRLVFAPEFGIAFFGGDPDNFTFPRFCLDMALFRVYDDDGQPVTAEHFLRWSRTGVREGDLVFASGHPGPTQRLNTVAHLEFMRDVGMPFALSRMERRARVLRAYAHRGPEEARQVSDDLFEMENGLKSYRGQLAGLQSWALLNRRRAEESALRRAVERNEKFRDAYGSAWSAVARSRSALKGFLTEFAMIENGAGFASQLFWAAHDIVRMVDELRKPDAERLPEYTDARLPTLERKLYAATPIYPELEVARLSDSLDMLRQTLGADHPVVAQVLAGEEPASRAAAIMRGTQLADVEVRRRLVAGGPEAVAASQDTMIALARQIDPAARAIRRRYEDSVASVERDAYSRIAQAVFAVKGNRAYPDGNGTLRLTYGQVTGVGSGATRVAPFTYLGGLFARARAHSFSAPFDLPTRWKESRLRLDPAVPFNFTTTQDIVGGNSGSPVVNRQGELVGVIFDGNQQSLPGYFAYDGSVNRAVAVDVRTMALALREVYKADALIEELFSAPTPVTVTGAAR
jgi:hypothetical protein